MAEDDALTALVVEKGQALAQCNVARLQQERTDDVDIVPGAQMHSHWYLARSLGRVLYFMPSVLEISAGLLKRGFIHPLPEPLYTTA